MVSGRTAAAVAAIVKSSSWQSVAMVIRGIIINCTTNGIGRLYADFQIAWDMYKAISRWNAPLNWQNTASSAGSIRTFCRMGPRWWSCLNCLSSVNLFRWIFEIWCLKFKVKSTSAFSQDLIKTIKSCYGWKPHVLLISTQIWAKWCCKVANQTKVTMRRGKNSSQAICLCQNLQKKLTESFFSFFLCSAGDGKKVEEKFG